MTELLAPAGSFEALRAAIANGANAVYLGGKNFSARAFADNFTLDEIADAVRLAHFHDVKIYVTVNTLVADNEMASLLFYVAELYKCGVDAVIVQDLGLIYLLKQAIPSLPLHASTQMTIHSSDGARLLKRHDVERAILARELSFDDMKAVKSGSDLELEGFIHGALCVCYSGQCLFSSMVGGRSGNRGRCAQPCRMAYRLTDEFGDEIESKSDGHYLLSPRDLFGYSELESLYEVGLSAWKIEGRMKKPHYVATVCRVYSRLLRELEEHRVIYSSDEDMRQLMQVFNRDRCIGYWRGNPGASLMSYTRPNNRGMFLGRITESGTGYIGIKLVQPLHRGDGVEIWQTGRREGCSVDSMTVKNQQRDNAEPGEVARIASQYGRIGDRVFKTYDAPLMESAEISYRSLPDKPLSFHVNAHIGEPVTVSVKDPNGFFSTRSSEYIAERAKKPTLPMNIVAVQLGRLGGTGYYLDDIKGDIAEDVLLPASVLNQLRRELVDDLFRKRHEADTDRPFMEEKLIEVAKNTEVKKNTRRRCEYKFRYSALVDSVSAAINAARRGVSDIYFDVCGFVGTPAVDWSEMSNQLMSRDAVLIPYLPQIILPHEEELYKTWLKEWQNNDCITAVMINNLGQIEMLKKNGWKKAVFAGSGLNVFNSAACRFLVDEGISRVMLSPEMTLAQIADIDSAGLETEIFAQGALQLMISEYCLVGAIRGGRNMEDGVESPCNHPCRHRNDYFLTDEKGYRFPLRFDNACRMHVFNSREHCLLEELPKLYESGVDRFMLDLRLYDERNAVQRLELYQQAAVDSFAYEEVKRKIGNVIKNYTKGHLYRGV